MKSIIKTIVLCLISQNLFAQSLQSGDRVVLRVTSGSDPNKGRYTYASGGGQLFIRSKLQNEQNDKYQAFTIRKINGNGEIRNNSKIYLITDDGLYLNCFDSRGVLSIQKTFSNNPAISDEIFTIQYQNGMRFYGNEIKNVKFITRKGLTLGIHERLPSALPKDTRSDDGGDALIADNRPEKFVLIKSSLPTQIGTAVSTSEQPSYINIINEKSRALGWLNDGHVHYGYVKPTAGGKGYVQYFSFQNRKTAIYYFPGQGTFAMDTAEMTAYDAAGQDNYAYVVSDPKSCGAGCGYNDMIMAHDNSEAVNVMGKFVYGAIYQKYKELNRWNGPLGIPTTSEGSGTNSLPEKGRFNHFQKGVIAFTGFTGAQALWGKTFTMWQKTDWERGWLGFPTQSCNPNSNSQVVVFERGSIDVGNGCDSYNNKGYYTDVAGKVVGGKPCY